MGKNDIFQSISNLSPEAIQKIVDRLEFRGKDPVFVKLRDAYIDRMDLASCNRILDLGCGTGVVARALAERDDFSGEIVGVDLSDALIDAAKHLSSEEGLAERIAFRVGDSHALDDPDSSYDAVLAHTLVSHVTDPASVVANAARVVAPGGTIAIFDGDYASLTFGAGDCELNATMVNGILDAVVANPFVMRDLPRLLAAMDLEIIDFLPELHAEAGHGSFFANMAESYVPMAVKAGTVSDQAGADWLSRQLSASEAGIFFGSCNYYAYLTRNPDRSQAP